MGWCAAGSIHSGSSVESGVEPGALRFQSRDLTTRPPRLSKHTNSRQMQPEFLKWSFMFNKPFLTPQDETSTPHQRVGNCSSAEDSKITDTHIA
ncbi:hypothetical protein AVEN_37804-1 [Araneus ventricosus]|uniref:Uncharacterized protein n=1 Tax=Araneus ventricosus TaxID=182803 RepID=A0A4Y2G414_ARAVE|nr:hypothetical protein AVEN_37804-1 [Araneus ventricosus]